MNKNLLYVLVIFSALAQALVQPLIYVEYHLRKASIIKDLCEERYATINTCDGRCFLVRKLNEAQKEKSKEKERSIKPFEVNVLLTQFSNPDVTTSYQSKNVKSMPFYLIGYSYLMDMSHDHPPEAFTAIIHS